jgi:hypothetical protein
LFFYSIVKELGQALGLQRVVSAANLLVFGHRFGFAMSQNQGFCQVCGFVGSVMLGSADGDFIKKIKPKGILFGVDLVEEALPECRPFGFADLTLED